MLLLSQLSWARRRPGPVFYLFASEIPPKPGNGKPKNQQGGREIRTWRKEVMTKIIELVNKD
jgi:hypothetical protein